MANAITKTSKQGITSFLSSDAVQQNVVQVVGKKDAQAFMSSIVSAVQTNKALSECTNSSILSAALLGHSLKLPQSPQLSYFYLVPFNNKDKKTGKSVMEAQFQLGYRGYIQLAIRSGQYKRLIVSEIKEGELIGYDPITEELHYKAIEDADRDKLETVGYYAKFELVNGFVKEMYWSKDKMEVHAETYSQSYKYDKSKGYKSSFWSKDFDAMAKKTMLRQLLSKWGIMSVEMLAAYDKDMTVLDEDGNSVFADNVVVEHTEATDIYADEVVENPQTVEQTAKAEQETIDVGSL